MVGLGRGRTKGALRGRRRRRATGGLAAAVVALFVMASSAAGQGQLTITTGPASVDGNYVNLSGTITSPNGCTLIGCPAYYLISTPGLPPNGGFAVGTLFWGNGTQPQSLPFTVNMPLFLSQFAFPPNTTTFTVVLAAEYGYSQVAYGSPQTFTWPAGTLAVDRVRLLATSAPRVAYRIQSTNTPFRSATVSITLRTRRGKLLGSFRGPGEPGQNVALLPKRLARKLSPRVRYRVTLGVRDNLGRRVFRSTLAKLRP